MSEPIMPKIVIEPIFYKDKIFHLIQDTYLPAGTKQRGWRFFQDLRKQGITEVVTYGTVYGYGQVATAWCCQKVGLRCTLFLPYTNPRTAMTQQAVSYGAKIIEIDDCNKYISTVILEEKATQYVLTSANTTKLIKLGLDDPQFIVRLAEGIRENWPSSSPLPQRIWLAGGSGVLARALATAFPNVILFIVQVGRQLYPDVLTGINYVKYVNQQPFPENTKVIPPYTSLLHYDAKVWKFVREYGEHGDYIFNVK